MRTVIKRAVMCAYCHGWISAATTTNLFRTLGLRRA